MANLRLQPKTACSRLPPVERVDLRGQERVELSRSPSGAVMTAILRLPSRMVSATNVRFLANAAQVSQLGLTAASRRPKAESKLGPGRAVGDAKALDEHV